MLLRCFPSSFGSTQLTVWEDMLFVEIHDGRQGGHLRHRNGMILAILNLYVAPMLPSSFSSIQLTVWEEMSFEEFQDGHHGGHLGYRNRTILAILNLYVAPMPPIKFWLNPTYDLGGYVVWRIWRPSWLLEQNEYSNSEPLCGSDASHQVWAQSDMVWEEMFE